MASGLDIAEGLAASLSVIPGVRVHAYAPDSFIPPGIVVGQPAIDWEPGTRTFCAITWEYPVLLAVARNTDREAQAALYALVEAVSDVLAEDRDLGGLVQTARLLGANPTSVTSNGQEFPAYALSVRIIA